MTAATSTNRIATDARVRSAAQHLYDAECALHAARQAHVDAWIAAAADKLHEAIVQHLSALDTVGRSETARGPCAS